MPGYTLLEIEEPGSRHPSHVEERLLDNTRRPSRRATFTRDRVRVLEIDDTQEPIRASRGPATRDAEPAQSTTLLLEIEEASRSRVTRFDLSYSDWDSLEPKVA